MAQRVEPLRVLALLEAYSITGPAKNLLQFAQIGHELTPRPIEVSIAAFHRQDASSLLLDTARQNGIPVYTIAERGRFDWGVTAQLHGIVTQVRPHIIQSHAVKSHFLTRLAGMQKQAPWIAFHHGYTWTDLKTRAYNTLDRWSLRASSRVVTMSMPFREQIVKMGVDPRRIHVVHNAVDPNWGRHLRGSQSEQMRAQLGIDMSKPVILIVGRLSREKDHITLVHAIRAVKDRGVAAHLLIAGAGPEQPAIENTVRLLGLGSDVTLTGHVSSAEIYYAVADIAVLSSRTEGSPNALLEAAAAQIPIVATSVGGIPEIVEHNASAILVEPGNIAQMAGGIEALLRDPELAAQLAGRAFDCVLKCHSPEVRARRLVEIYNTVIPIG